MWEAPLDWPEDQRLICIRSISACVCGELIDPAPPAAGRMADEDPFVFQSTLIFAQRSNRKPSAAARERCFDASRMHRTLTNLPGWGLRGHIQPFHSTFNFIELALQKNMFGFFVYLRNAIARPVYEPLQQELDAHWYDPSYRWRSHGYSLEQFRWYICAPSVTLAMTKLWFPPVSTNQWLSG